MRVFMIRRSRGPSFFSFLVLILSLFLVIQGFSFIEKKLRPPISAMAFIMADRLATDAINYAIIQKIARGILYKDLILTDKDHEGRIVMAQLNTMEVNRLIAETTIATQEALAQLEKEPLSIPLGAALDSYLLATYGPKIPVKILPMGRVNTRLIDAFEEAGINQVRHKIYLEVHTEMMILIPFMSSSLEVITSVPIADTIYPGKVPDTVINLRFS